ncbi:MAG TPA: hypothetical protein ENI94_13060 [Gammaproteobacteria bacterium]|nr:hypothetical protein [Gammaproteobacteria bacterium]
MTADHDITEQSADDRLVAYAAIAMKEKLRVARLKGRGGWWNPDECNIEQLRHMLQEHLEKGDVVDVMNFAAMIYARECADT